LAEKKGSDMLVDIIPEILDKHPNAYFIIGGDGPKRPLLDKLVEKYNLGNRVEVLGAVPHE
jgi:phosphatidylinositol glycan class A protein